MNISLEFPQYFYATHHEYPHDEGFFKAGDKQKSLCVFDPYRILKKLVEVKQKLQHAARKLFQILHHRKVKEKCCGACSVLVYCHCLAVVV